MTNDGNSLCIYCGNQTKRVRRGEHILPKAIGGALCIKEESNRTVCARVHASKLGLVFRAFSVEGLTKSVQKPTPSNEKPLGFSNLDA